MTQLYAKDAIKHLNRVVPKNIVIHRRKLQRKHAYWCCMKHDTSLTDCAMLPIAEESIYDAFCRLYYKLKHQSNSIFRQMLASLQAIRNQRMFWSPDIVSLNKKISELSSQNQTLAFLKQQGLVDPDIFISQTNELTKQLRQVGEVVIHKEEANVVQQIFKQYLMGESLQIIADALREQGVIYDDGRSWNKNTIARILEDERYAGKKV